MEESFPLLSSFPSLRLIPSETSAAINTVAPLSDRQTGLGWTNFRARLRAAPTRERVFLGGPVRAPSEQSAVSGQTEPAGKERHRRFGDGVLSTSTLRHGVGAGFTEFSIQRSVP